MPLPIPGLGADLHGLPGTAQRRGVRQVKVAYRIDRHAVEDGGRGDVDALSDFGVLVPEQLHAEQLAGGAVAGGTHGDPVAAPVISLVVISLRPDGDRVEPGRGRLVIAES